MINEEGLRDWFGKSKSKDGKPGWVQSDGSPCANEPGEKSFCARMKGMKKKLTSDKTARDPDSRINKSLRAWNC